MVFEAPCDDNMVAKEKPPAIEALLFHGICLLYGLTVSFQLAWPLDLFSADVTSPAHRMERLLSKLPHWSLLWSHNSLFVAKQFLQSFKTKTQHYLHLSLA